MSVRVVEVEPDTTDDEVRRLVTTGVVVWRDDWTSLFVHDSETGDVDEISPDEHGEYVEIGTIHGRPAIPDEEDLDGDDFLEGWVGRLGTYYFQKSKDPMGWELLGELDSDEEAIEMACGVDFYFERS